ncbi:MAG: 1-acyl-sn-glycerol-3-phosphate acyltransferase [Oscillospiraceae bacterium]|nr:1-acyl-sn-glycerol-3-phosphate acyltransferase [Oscillospiraceae bacterium]
MEKISSFFYRFLRYFVQWYFFGKYKFTVYGKEKLPKKYSGGYIIACNHQSYSDPPAIAACVKGRFSFMAKDELFRKNPFFAFIIRMAGAFPVVRGAGDSSVIDKSVSFIKKGRILVIFPEGTRSKDGNIGKAKSGVALIAAMSNAPVLPVCIMYGLDKSSKKKSIDFMVGDMIPASEVAVTDLEGGGRREIKRVSEVIMGNIKELQSYILKKRGINSTNE